MWTNQKFVDHKKSEVEVKPKGWLGPITIEYAILRIGDYDPVNSVCFRVKGTNHTFAKFENLVNLSFQGNYAKFFTSTLESFREDFISWQKNPEFKDCQWRREYEDEYRGKIILE